MWRKDHPRCVLELIPALAEKDFYQEVHVILVKCCEVGSTSAPDKRCRRIVLIFLKKV